MNLKNVFNVSNPKVIDFLGKMGYSDLNNTEIEITDSFEKNNLFDKIFFENPMLEEF